MSSGAAARVAKAPQFCVVLQTPCPSVARTADIVRTCSEQQGGGACSVMVVQVDGQVVSFSVASVETLVPLQKSACVAPRVFVQHWHVTAHVAGALKHPEVSSSVQKNGKVRGQQPGVVDGGKGGGVKKRGRP